MILMIIAKRCPVPAVQIYSLQIVTHRQTKGFLGNKLPVSRWVSLASLRQVRKGG